MSFLNRLTAGMFAFALVCGAQAQEAPKSQPPLWSAKPGIADFNKIEDNRLAAGQKFVDSMLAVKGQRTVENTLVPFDAAITQLNSTIYFSAMMQQIHPEEKYRDAATEMTRKASAAQTALQLNPDVYKALAGIDLSHADAATAYYVKRQLLEFRLAGVDKDEATRAKV